MILSDEQRKNLNKRLPSGLFIDSSYKLRLKKVFGGKLYEKQFGTYDPELVLIAEEFLAEIKKKSRLQALGLQLAPETLTLGKAIDLFWMNFASKKETRLAVHIYRLHLDRIREFFGAERPVHTITTQECQEFRDWCSKRITRYGKKVTGSTVNKDHTALIALFNKLDRWQAEGFIGEHIKLHKRNPAKYIRKAGESESKIKAPTLEQFQALLINASDNAMRRIILGAGVMMRRKKELLEMRKSTHVDAVNGVIKGLVSKRKSEDEDRHYTVIITPTVQMLLDTSPGDYLFNFANFPKRWERTLLRAGLRQKTGVRVVNGRDVQDWKNLVEFRALRKVGGTLLNLVNTDPRTIQEMYRHSSLEMTQRYVGVVPEALRTAAGRLDQKLAWREKLDDSMGYTPKFKTPNYLKRL
jgi:hypothetical protein